MVPHRTEQIKILFFPTDVWEGLLVTGVLFIITWIGVQCTFSLQSPEKFEGGRK